jgi:hypothetical protein
MSKLDPTLVEDSALENDLQEGVIEGTKRVRLKDDKQSLDCLIQKQMEMIKVIKEIQRASGIPSSVNITINTGKEEHSEPEEFSIFTGKIKKDKKDR